MGRIILPTGAMTGQTLDDYKPLNQQQVAMLAQPVIQAIAQGIQPETVSQIEFGVLCQLLVTVKTLGMAGAAMEAERDALAKELADLKVATLAPRLSFDFLGAPVEVANQQRAHTDCLVCERVTDENGVCSFCAANPAATPMESL